MDDRLIYLDNAATSYPKPPTVLDEMLRQYRELGVSPGRGSYDRAVQAGDAVAQARKKVARFFGAPDPDRVVFAANATDALNLFFHGLLQPGDHVVSTQLEHNSVLRPLHYFRERGWIKFDLAPCNGQGFVDPDDIARRIQSNTRAVVVTHASNVLGTIQPIASIGRICAERGVPLALDVSQSAGTIPIDMAGWHLSAVAFTGHKALFGPTGIGGLVLHPDLDVRASRFGGTGVDSRNLAHTPTFPHRLEAGTLNLIGILGLSAGLDFLAERGLEAIHAHEMALLTRLRDGLAGSRHVEMYCATALADHVAVLTLNLDGINPEDAGAILDADFDIAVRVGLHCAPLTHQFLGTYHRGAVRFSPGLFNTVEDIDVAIQALSSLSARSRPA
jgi:cysteine desulfurase / selenocysteine lyase